MTIETTLDAGHQEKAYATLSQALEKFDLDRVAWEKSKNMPLSSTAVQLSESDVRTISQEV